MQNVAEICSGFLKTQAFDLHIFQYFHLEIINNIVIKDKVLLKTFDGSKRLYKGTWRDKIMVRMEKRSLIKFVPLWYMLSNYLKAFIYYFDEAMGKYTYL